MSGNRASPTRPVFYILFGAALLSFFFWAIRIPLAESIFEQDLVWFVPNLIWQSQGLSGLAFLKFVLAPSLWYMDPVTKSYFLISHALFGVQIKYYIAVTLAIHLCSAGLLYIICRQARLSFQTAYFAALSSFFFFAQFHAVLWPMAFQHVIVVFFMLLGLALYFKTDATLSGGRPFWGLWGITAFINLIASFCRFNIVILPAMMLMHILICSTTDAERLRKLRIWLPVVAIYLGNPVYSLFYAGDNRIHLDFTAYPYWLAVLVGILALVAAYYIYNGYTRLRRLLSPRKEVGLWITGAGIAVIGVLLIKKFTNGPFEIVFSTLIPVIGCFESFLTPLHVALHTPSTFAYYLIPVQASVATFLIVATWLGYFVWTCWREHRALLVFAVWYLICFVFLVHQNPIRGRYFIFLAPLFAVVFWTVCLRILDVLIPRLTLRRVAATTLMVGLLVANIAAIPLSFFRGKLTNQLFSYDYVRSAILSKDRGLPPHNAQIGNTQPFPYAELGYQPLTKELSDHYFNAKAVFAQVFGDNTYFDVRFDEKWPPTAHISPLIEPFDGLLSQARAQLNAHRDAEAKALLLRAIAQRPFLFHYLLGDLAWADLRWVTDHESSVNDWLREVSRSYQIPDVRLDSNVRRAFMAMQHDSDAMVECLFYLAYLDHKEGHTEDALNRIKQLKLIENSGERLRQQLTALPTVAGNPELRKYADEVVDHLRYKDWNAFYNYYAFEKFVLRMLGR